MDAFHDTVGAHDINSYVISIANVAYKYGVSTSAAWTNSITNRIVETYTSTLGDPSRFAQGTHVTTLQNTFYDDNYILYLDTILNPTSLIDHSIFRIMSEEIYDIYSYLGELYSIPEKTESKKYGPVLVTLDWDTSLVNPSEAKPIYKYYNIIEGSRGAYSLIINHACTSIMRNYSWPAITSFCNYTTSSAGTANIARWISTNGGSYDASLMDYIRATEERMGVVYHVASRLHKQYLSNADVKTSTIAMARGIFPSEGERYLMMNASSNRFNKLKALCMANPTKITYSLISSKVTYYNIQGPMTSVVSIETALNEAGGTSQLKSASHDVPSESIIKWTSPLKRNVIWPVGDTITEIYSTDEISFGRIQIPCTNWNDVRRVQENIPEVIKQYSKSYTFVADTLYKAVNAFYSSIRELGIKNASMTYDGIKGHGTYDVTYTYAA